MHRRNTRKLNLLRAVVPCRFTPTAVVCVPSIAANWLEYQLGKTDYIPGRSGAVSLESSVVGWVAATATATEWG